MNLLEITSEKPEFLPFRIHNLISTQGEEKWIRNSKSVYFCLGTMECTFMALFESSGVKCMVYNSALLNMYSPNNLHHQKYHLYRNWSRTEIQN